MNRYLKILLVVLLAVPGLSCSDWLNVSPKSEKTEGDVFSSEGGYKSALTGAYILAGTKELYGRNTTLLLPESFLHHWTIPSALAALSASDEVKCNYYISQYEFKNVDAQNMINQIWTGYYNCILQLNNILKHLEDTDVDFQFDNDKIIEGEALGLRAFLHLDILRFFGPIPTDASLSGAAIPYVDEVSRDPNKSVSVSYSTVLEKILRDLDRAEKLLKEADPILTYSLPDLRTLGSYNREAKPDDEWHWNRQMRFNYYAVLAAKARYYLWIGDKTNAAKYADMVVTAKEEDGTLKFPLADEAYYQSSASFNPHVLPVEFIFGAYNSKHLTEVINPMITIGADARVDSYKSVLMQDMDLTDIAYELGINGNDIRYQKNRYWKQFGLDAVNIFIKYGGPQEDDPINYIPMIRVAEMYLILLECLPIAKAKPLFEEYRKARNMDMSVQDEFEEHTLMERLEKEYRKEFYGEGQMFHYYKRLNITTYGWPTFREIQRGNYVIPKPVGQTMFE